MTTDLGLVLRGLLGLHNASSDELVLSEVARLLHRPEPEPEPFTTARFTVSVRLSMEDIRHMSTPALPDLIATLGEGLLLTDAHSIWPPQYHQRYRTPKGWNNER